ncbi:mCG1035214, partial [Mus musculus]
DKLYADFPTRAACRKLDVAGLAARDLSNSGAAVQLLRAEAAGLGNGCSQERRHRFCRKSGLERLLGDAPALETVWHLAPQPDSCSF